jgi:hypothetical protein
MRADQTRLAVLIACGIGAVVLVGYAGASDAGGSSQGREMASRLTEALEAALPKDTLQLYPRAVRAEGASMRDLTVYRYDFDEIDRLEKRYQGVSRAEFLRGIFARAVKGHEGGSDNEKWLAVIDYFSRAMRHPSLEQPMYRDRSVVSDPLILLLLREGRCGLQAGVIVDLALTNHYEARLVHVACHFVAEVKWGQKWHWVDADGGVPVDSLRSRFAELPSVEELARTPYVLDSFAFRNWRWGDNAERTLDGVMVSRSLFLDYPGELLPSAIYFGNQVFLGAFVHKPAPKTALAYYYKKGTIAQWETDRYWGWKDLHVETSPIPTVPVAYAPQRLRISGPQAVFAEGGRAVIPVRWTAQGRPVCQPDQVWNCKLAFDTLGYEVRVSRATRGWDYDFRDYQYMPKSGKGDVLVTRDVRKIDSQTYGIDLPVQDVPEVYIEVVPVALDQAHRNDFMWPSNELAVPVLGKSPRATP